MSNPLEEKETLSSIALDLLQQIDEEHQENYEIDSAIIIATTKTQTGEDKWLFMRTLNGQKIWTTAGLIKAAEMNLEARWHGWEDQPDDENETH